RLRRYFQFGTSIGINSYYKGFVDKAIYQGQWKSLCVPVLNCYACPSAVCSCPIGTMQHFMVVRAIPYYVIGLIASIGVIVGRMPCGTLCPFGFFQDMLHKMPSVKVYIPKVLRFFRYAVLVGLVFILPWITAENWFSKLCPMGTLIGGLPWVTISPEVRSMIRDLFWIKVSMLIFFTASSVVAKRPFCQVVCPLGAFFGLFNRFSLLRLEWDAAKCTHCRKCQEICPMEIEVWKGENTGHCIRCLDCTDCEAIRVSTVLGGDRVQPEAQEAIAKSA
ncbi:MAG TPA: 4Fe-4S binding protein, partial [Geobacteraceae bacterium]